ncbi:MBOAT family protein [Roseovarius sp. A21]|uniref:Probable alginate O-acetylase AlgI n=1 Tax=Roseovarius bejariae TaxID=2576383 RepID=A0A844CJB8_9RHOB|nr:MBOAT family O-acyltransferase [Roseovarius bejariae]MRU14762.1 MBOAT family protein [Roseovarius bejariae]
MLFTSLEFLLFLPVAVVLFWWLPARWRLPWLLLASLGFYASFAIENLAYLGVVALIALAAGRYLATPDAGNRRLVLWSGILAILGLMFALKYYDPLVEDLAWLPRLGLSAPAGFSFYAFTAIALLIDRYRTPAEASANIRQDALYLAWFPKLLAGPIERITPFTAELTRRAPMKPAHFALGGQLFLWGLVKKVVVADNLAPFVDRTYAIPAYAVPLELIIATYFFAFQIYCDFSGYTDMARGASRLFGIRLSQNFRRAYFAQSISEFWSRRWHISLADWFRDYLYYPFMGPSRTALRMYLGLMIVFMVSGIWHAGLGYGIGWGFLAWGALNGVYLCVERALNPIRRTIRVRLKGSGLAPLYGVLTTLLVFHLVLVSWVFFRAADLGDGMTVISRIAAALPELPRLVTRYPFTAEQGFLAALVAGLLIIELVMEQKRLRNRLARAPRVLRWAAIFAGLFALLLLGRWQSEAFVYMQF